MVLYVIPRINPWRWSLIHLCQYCIRNLLLHITCLSLFRSGVYHTVPVYPGGEFLRRKCTLITQVPRGVHVCGYTYMIDVVGDVCECATLLLITLRIRKGVPYYVTHVITNMSVDNIFLKVNMPV